MAGTNWAALFGRKGVLHQGSSLLAGRIAAGMSGGFDVAFPPEGQGPRMPSLAVLTPNGALEWSHFHGLIDDAAVAPDGWMATCGALHTLDYGEWDFLNSLAGI